MPFPRPLTVVCAFFLGFSILPGQEASLSTRYLQLQEGYTQRLNTIENEFRKNERELLNDFILSLPRIEKRFRNEGMLEGVIATRNIQENVLAEMQFPSPDEELPGELAERVETLLHERETARQEYQEKLDALNRILHDALEPYKKAFTIAGEFDTAMEIRAIQLRLAGELPMEEEEDAPFRISNDPNAIPFCLEPAGYADFPGVSPLEPAIAFEPEIDGRVDVVDKGFVFRRGKLVVPDKAMTVLLEGVRKNQMLSIDFGLRPQGIHQGHPEAPAILLLYGNSLTEANLAITHEGRDLYLYLRTTMEPEEDRPYHRIHLGPAEGGRAQHYAISFRSGELNVFKDGDPIRKLRGEPRGLLSNWEDYPVIMGENSAPPNLPDLPDVIFWRGHIHHVHMRSTLDSDVAENFKRFKNVVTH